MQNFITKRVLVAMVFAFSLLGCSQRQVPDPLPDASIYNFFVMSDMGETLNYGNDSTASAMNEMAPIIRPRFIISTGDLFHNNGVKSTTDSLWDLTNSKVFASPYMKIDVFPINGNHEYIGNSQATVDYSAINQHWKMAALNYTFVKKSTALLPSVL